MSDLAARMYQHADKPTVGGTDGEAAAPEVVPVAQAEPAQAADEPAPASSDDPAEEESLSERMYGAGEPPPNGDYNPLVRQVFEPLEIAERDDPEHMAAIAEGRQQVVDTLREWGVSAPATRELSSTFAAYRREPQSEEAMEEAGARTEARLREAWGRRYDENVRFARTAFAEAAKRMPWLAEEIDNGAGNDITVIKHFARIGRQLARSKK